MLKLQNKGFDLRGSMCFNQCFKPGAQSSLVYERNMKPKEAGLCSAIVEEGVGFAHIFSGLFLGIFHTEMNKTLQNHKLAYIGKKTLPISKNNIKLRLLFPTASKTVV